MKYLLAATLALCCATTVNAAGDAASGKGKAASCEGCHGTNGVGIGPTFPNLAGQKAEYLLAQLMAFKSGERKGANSTIMLPMVAGLSEQDMADLAAYFSSLPAAN